jgi:acyl-CoA thioester hydrolase
MNEPPVGREHFAFFHRLRVRWAEVDRQDVVFNPNYFVYFDVAVGEYWRAIGFRYPDDLRPTGSDVFAVDARARFLAPARYDDDLDVGCRVSVLGRSSKTCELAVFRGQDLLTVGTLVYVHTDLVTRRSAPWPEAVRARILAFERTPPASSSPR